MGKAPPSWNTNGGLDVAANKLCLGVAAYGYTFKAHWGEEIMKATPYKNITLLDSNAATSYDERDPHKENGFLKKFNLYYETPKLSVNKLKYSL